jgi:hypothetical protein
VSFFLFRSKTSNHNRTSTSLAMRKSKTMSFPPNPHMLAKTAKPASLASQIKSSTSTKSLNNKESGHYAFPLMHPSKSRLTLDLRNGFHGSKESRKNGYKCSESGEDLEKILIYMVLICTGLKRLGFRLILPKTFRSRSLLPETPKT